MSNFRSSALALTLLVGGPLATIQAEDAKVGEAELSQATAIANSGSSLAARIQGMLNAARQDGDIVKVPCLNDKLTQANKLVADVKAQVANLRSAVQVGETDQAQHAFNVITVLGERFKAVDGEAAQCVGQDMYESGSAQVVTETDANIVPVDMNAAAVSAGSPPPPNATTPPPISPTS